MQIYSGMREISAPKVKKRGWKKMKRKESDIFNDPSESE